MNAITSFNSVAINIDVIRADGGTQSRAQLYDSVVADYADQIAAGANFPPVIVFFDGESYWLADGFHRHAAHVSLGLAEIDADIRQGSRRDAILFSVGANASHGLRRTNLVSAPLVATVRQSVTVNSYSDEPRTYTTKHGTTSTMNTENIGRPREPSAEGMFSGGLNRIRDENAMLEPSHTPQPIIDLKGRARGLAA